MPTVSKNSKGEIVGVVGSEGAKFTKATERLARKLIRREIKGASLVVSGACHLGGIDIWVREEAKALGIPFVEYPPAKLQWEGGYKQRNVRIAKRSGRVVCITVASFPKTYDGPRYTYCYHCGTSDHIKSGGCWTTKYARRLGKEGKTLVVGKRDP